MKKIPVKKLEITGGECEPAEGWPKPAETWADFHWQLAARVHRAAPGGGYDKTNVLVTWQDGETFGARLDIDANGADSDLAKLIQRRIRYYAGLLEEHQVKDWDQYQRIIELAKKNGERDRAVAWLAKYDLPAYDLQPPNNGSRKRRRPSVFVASRGLE